MEIGTDRVAVAGPFGTVGSVVTESADDHAKGSGFRAEIGAAAMVLEADDFTEVCLQDHVANASVGAGAGVARFEVEDADAGNDASLVVDVAVAEELEPSTNGEDGHIRFNGIADGRAFFDEVIGDAALFAVLAAADEEEVEHGGIEGVTDRDVLDGAFDIPGATSVLEGDDVAAVAVDVHDIRVEMRDADLKAGSVHMTTVAVGRCSLGRRILGFRHGGRGWDEQAVRTRA